MAQDKEPLLALKGPDFSKSMFINFDVEREDWNSFRLSDGTFLRAKIVFSGFMVEQDIDQLARGAQPGKPAKLGFGFRSSNVFGVEAPKELRGTPDTRKYSADELQASVVEKVSFESIRVTWNSYLLANGMQVKARVYPTSVGRTDKFDEAGMPIYWVESGVEVMVDLPARIQAALAKKAQAKKKLSNRNQKATRTTS